jgi:hypothetical protein
VPAVVQQNTMVASDILMDVGCVPWCLQLMLVSGSTGPRVYTQLQRSLLLFMSLTLITPV